MNPFKKCKECKECCNTHNGGRLIVPLTNREQVRFKRKELVVNGDCEFLGEKGCTLDDKSKPVICHLFPLVPYKRELVVSECCPLAEGFKNNIVVGSPEFKHYIGCRALWDPLTDREKIRLSKLYRNIKWTAKKPKETE
ncbi:hypothetical protein K9M79_02940 [Candidatus Woesearchaeota archaeon]|nr:hypothetical protein [Candidatus Woesearchaeota archaeon]